MRPIATLVLLFGCENMIETPPTPEEQAAEKCPQVHLDRMEGDWVLTKGAAADPKTRLRLVKEGEGYVAYFVDGFYTKYALEVKVRDDDAMLTEQPVGRRKGLVDAGEAALVRLYLTPKYETCSMHVNKGTFSPSNDKEDVSPKTIEFVPFPPMEEKLSYHPADGDLFLDDAAKDKKKADKQLEELMMPKAETEAVPLTVGTWTDAASDGDAGCTFDFDLYLNDRLQSANVQIAAGPVEDGFRHWVHEWEPANYEGNDHIEMARYRTCGGPRTLIGVSAIEAVFMF